MIETIVVARLLRQALTAQDCVLGGFCVGPDRAGPPSGLMYLALGFVAAGGFGLWREWREWRARRRPTQP